MKNDDQLDIAEKLEGGWTLGGWGRCGERRMGGDRVVVAILHHIQ
jgi:hypothetical protein